MDIVDKKCGIIYHLRECGHHKAADEIERLRKLNKLIRPDDQYADYNFGATKVRHGCVDCEKQGDFEACHRDRRGLIDHVERLRAALEEQADKVRWEYEQGFDAPEHDS